MAVLRAACFGKLPFHREFLRLGLDSGGASWVVHWLEAAHEAWSRAGTAPDASAAVRFAAPAPAGSGLVAGVVRQSSDGLRRHPVAVFVSAPEGVDAARWHLLPLALDDTWAGLEALLAREFGAVAELDEALAAGVPGPALDAAEESYRTALALPVTAPSWEAFAGGEGDGARHLALNLLTVARAQREAQGAADGVSLVVPLHGEPPSVRASLWLELFAAAAGVAVQPVIALHPDPVRLFAFYRPAEGADLAAMLSSPAMAPIDDLSEAWQTLPPSEAALASALDAVVAAGGETLGSLPARLRAAAAL